MKNKFSHHILIDAILLVLIVFLSLGSFIMEWCLPCGGGHGSGHGIGMSARTCLGMNRHSWGNLHMYIGIIFIILLIYHIIQHRGIITAYLNKRVTSPTLLTLINILLVVLLTIAILPWICFVFC